MRREKDTGRDALADTLSFADSFSLADSFLVDSAPQDLHVRASVNTAQAPLTIFLMMMTSSKRTCRDVSHVTVTTQTGGATYD